jgi:hypothetical protein
MRTSQNKASRGKENADEKRRTNGSIKRERIKEERKTVQKIDFYTEEQRKELYKSIGHRWDKFDGLEAKDAFEQLYGFHPNVNIFARENEDAINKMEARKWWERTDDISSQCNNVIGKFKEGISCYICGFPILTPPAGECEHILSVYKAAMYLNLYRGEYKPLFDTRYEKIIYDSNQNPLSELEMNIIKHELGLEYEWSHKCCNQVKSSDDVIMFTQTRKRTEFEIDSKSITRILEKIAEKLYSGKSDICSDVKLKWEFENEFDKPEYKLKKTLSEKVSQWVNKRIDILNAKRTRDSPPGTLRRILDYLNGNDVPEGFPKPLTAAKSGAAFVLTSLAKAIVAADMTTFFTTWRYINGLPAPAPTTPVGEIISKATINTKIVKLFSNLSYNWKRTIDTREMYDFYKDILHIPINVQLARDNSRIEFFEIGMLSLQYVNDTNPEFKDFFRNTLALVKYPPLTPNQYVTPPLFSDIYEASEIAEICYSMLIILTYMQNINTSSVFQAKKLEMNMVGFLSQFEAALKVYIDKVVSQVSDIEKRCTILSIFYYLSNRIDNLNDKDIKISQILKDILTNDANFACNNAFLENNLWIAEYPEQEGTFSNLDNAVTEYIMEYEEEKNLFPMEITEKEDTLMHEDGPDTKYTKERREIAAPANVLLNLQGEKEDLSYPTRTREEFIRSREERASVFKKKAIERGDEPLDPADARHVKSIMPVLYKRGGSIKHKNHRNSRPLQNLSRKLSKYKNGGTRCMKSNRRNRKTRKYNT